jgi:hypothetical protein
MTAKLRELMSCRSSIGVCAGRRDTLMVKGTFLIN